MALTKTLEISLVGSSIELIYSNHSGQKLPAEYYPVCGIKSIKGVPDIGHSAREANNNRRQTYPFTDMLQVVIEFDQKEALKFDIQSVTNQPGWTANLAGLVQAVTDINGWAGECGCCAETAIALDTVNENLVNILNAIIASDQDVEVLLVRDTGNSNQVVQQIIDYTTGVPVYSYRDVNGAVYVPVGPLVYLDPSAVLNLILTQITAINNNFTGTLSSVVSVNISGLAAYNVPSCYAWELIVTSGTVTDGTIVYPAGTYPASAPLLKNLPAGTILNAVGATAYVRIMNL